MVETAQETFDKAGKVKEAADDKAAKIKAAADDKANKAKEAEIAKQKEEERLKRRLALTGLTVEDVPLVDVQVFHRGMHTAKSLKEINPDDETESGDGYWLKK